MGLGGFWSYLISFNYGHGAICVCPEKQWPYDISKFKDKPTQECYDKAKKRVVTEVTHLKPTLPELKACLASNLPFVF